MTGFPSPGMGAGATPWGRGGPLRVRRQQRPAPPPCVKRGTGRPQQPGGVAGHQHLHVPVQPVPGPAALPAERLRHPPPNRLHPSHHLRRRASASDPGIRRSGQPLHPDLHRPSPVVREDTETTSRRSSPTPLTKEKEAEPRRRCEAVRLGNPRSAGRECEVAPPAHDPLPMEGGGEGFSLSYPSSISRPNAPSRSHEFRALPSDTPCFERDRYSRGSRSPRTCPSTGAGRPAPPSRVRTGGFPASRSSAG